MDFSEASVALDIADSSAASSVHEEVGICRRTGKGYIQTNLSAMCKTWL